MIKRLFLCLITTACLLGLTGCASSPIYRAVAQAGADKKDVFWILPPSIGIGTSVNSKYGTQYPWFYIALPLQQSTCPYARFPKKQPESGKLQGEFVPAQHGGVLRLKSTGAFLEEQALRAAWKGWWSDAKKDWPGKCLDIDPEVTEQMLVERRPLRFTEMMKLYYGFDESTRSVILRPGTTVCATDVSYRSNAADRFSSIGESCATAISDGQGGAVFAPATITLGYISTIDTNKSTSPDECKDKCKCECKGDSNCERKCESKCDRESKGVVRSIASWAELPSLGLVGHQFLLRHPKSLPMSPKAMPLPTDAVDTNAGSVPLLIAVDARVEGSISRALQCVKDVDDDEILDVCGEGGFEAVSCGEKLPESGPLSELKHRKPQCFRFGERGIIAPKIAVTVNGTPIEVPLGTTLGAALERMTPPFPQGFQLVGRPSAAHIHAHDVVSGIRLQRMFEGRPTAVDLTDAGASALGLVLLPGDQLSW